MSNWVVLFAIKSTASLQMSNRKGGAGEEPPYLTVGTDVSAKYRGAFCEAKVKKVTRVVKCKVNFKGKWMETI